MNQQKQDKLYLTLCEEAYPTDKDGRRRKGRQMNPLACAECESPCQWGIEMLKELDEKAFRDLLCGADCNTCRQPCNLRRISQSRKITKTISHKEKMRKSWLAVALRPYNQRREQNQP